MMKKSRIRETPNLSTDADSKTNIFVSAGVQEGADSVLFLFFCKKNASAAAVVVAGIVASQKDIKQKKMGGAGPGGEGGGGCPIWNASPFLGLHARARTAPHQSKNEGRSAPVHANGKGTDISINIATTRPNRHNGPIW